MKHASPVICAGALLIVVLAGLAAAHEPQSAPPARPPGLLSRLFSPARPLPLQAQSQPRATSDRANSAVRANWEEPAPQEVAPPAPLKPQRGLNSLLRRPRKPTRTISQYMSQERP
ncbi:MAG: hypothetical protein AB7O59_10345 [Pirellulales bacterium]